MKSLVMATLCAALSITVPVIADSQSFNDEYNLQWGLDLIGAAAAWEYIENEGLQPGGQGTTIAVLDDGLDPAHPEFGSRVLNRNPVSGNHGNYVAAIAAAEYNGTGIVGVAPYANLVSADPDTKNEIRTLDIYDIDVFSMSFGMDKPVPEDAELTAEFQTLEADMRYLFKKHSDAVFVASAGQEGGGKTHGYPAGWAGEDWVGGRMIVVGALNQSANDEMVPGSFNCDAGQQNLSDYCLFAPGDQVIGALGKRYKVMNDRLLENAQNSDSEKPEYSAEDIYTFGVMPNEFYLVASGGTSAAVPFVSGTAAVIRAINPNLSASEVVDLILHTAEPYHDSTEDSALQPSMIFGWGVLDLEAASQAAISRRH